MDKNLLCNYMSFKILKYVPSFWYRLECKAICRFWKGYWWEDLLHAWHQSTGLRPSRFQIRMWQVILQDGCSSPSIYFNTCLISWTDIWSALCSCGINSVNTEVIWHIPSYIWRCSMLFLVFLTAIIIEIIEAISYTALKWKHHLQRNGDRKFVL